MKRKASPKPISFPLSPYEQYVSIVTQALEQAKPTELVKAVVGQLDHAIVVRFRERFSSTTPRMRHFELAIRTDVNETVIIPVYHTTQSRRNILARLQNWVNRVKISQIKMGKVETVLETPCGLPDALSTFNAYARHNDIEASHHEFYVARRKVYLGVNDHLVHPASQNFALEAYYQ